MSDIFIASKQKPARQRIQKTNPIAGEGAIKNNSPLADRISAEQNIIMQKNRLGLGRNLRQEPRPDRAIHYEICNQKNHGGRMFEI